jgi:hypothetical protein
MARAKTVHTIEYKNKGANLKIPLKLVIDPHYKGSPSLEYQINLDEPIYCRLSGKDPEVLTKQLFEMLDKHLEIRWKPYLYVRVSFGETNCNFSGSDTTGRELHLMYDTVLIGEKPDGTFVHDFYDGSREPFKPGDSHKPRYGNYQQDKPEVTELKKRWRGHDRDDAEAKSLIEDTPENRAALARIHESMEVLAGKLGELLAPEVIQATLSSLPLTMGIRGPAEPPVDS